MLGVIDTTLVDTDMIICIYMCVIESEAHHPQSPDSDSGKKEYVY